MSAAAAQTDVEPASETPDGRSAKEVAEVHLGTALRRLHLHQRYRFMSTLQTRSMTRAALQERELRAQITRAARGLPEVVIQRVFSAWKRPAQPAILTCDELWLTQDRPLDLEAVRPQHQCTICLNVKSHPVSYVCGHSYCYVCIRVWLEDNGTCPTCRATMLTHPFVHRGEVDELASTYPADPSKIDYNWDGLTFPHAL
ncbi:hypothetical protein C8R43DRAFT_1122727 [Mycena crocata]|nr:hypothetical protein C8R43DRAFT_1122727 [Mycena crocata]